MSAGDTFMTVWLVIEPDDGTTIAVFDNETDAAALAANLAGERGTGSRYGVEATRVYDRLPDDWRVEWRYV